ncbi:TonB-dependent receptor [Flavobacterium sp. NRK1]|uniref:TonB-dependent receptor n=1 Tax=Flavobacterium sp. NRK1 TaxID=2954929 RepID=UPI002092C429|nr:TonB-dependent receptor [Flavobacterium sp. NRK1]MCO6148016.1 TonB-dependent receptor [Flavobacterium sp. NRK1]
MKLKFSLIALFIFALGFAQNKGTITGTITDKDMNNETLPFASVAVKGTPNGTNADENGKYSLSVQPGTVTLVFGFLGYETKEVQVTVKANETKVLNQALASTSVQLEDVVIEKTVNREKETALLMDQKNAAIIKQSIGAQELTRKGVSDAAQAVTKVTGISKQEGNSGIFVRGLGDRYNSTMLNGLPLPSNEPENKNVALNLFSTDIIQSVGISKTYDVSQYGDMGGANVDIISKEHTGNGKLNVKIGSGLNNQAFDSNFKMADGANKSGFYNVNTPTSTKEYQFGTKWSPVTESNPVNGSFGISGGKNFNFKDDSRFSVFATANYGNGYTYKKGSQKNVTANDEVSTDYYNVNKYEFSTKTTLMANLAYKLDAKNTIKLNSIFVNASKSTVGEYDTYLGQGDARYEFNRQTLTQQNKLFVNQLLGKHDYSERLDIDWGASYSTVNADMPDRITNNLVRQDSGLYTFNTAAPTTNNRYFQYIDEKEYAFKAIGNLKVLKGEDELYKGKLSFGYNGRIKSRDFEATQFNFRVGQAENQFIDKNNLDSFLNASNQSLTQNVPGTFYITTSRLQSLKPFTYNADLSVHSGLANFEHNLSDKLTYTVGLRAEKVLQELKWDTNIPLTAVTPDDAKIDKVYILPAATLKYSVTEKSNLRAALSKTYTLPQFKEKAPFRYEGIGENSVGNPFLKASDNYNVDFKWEMFPENDEVYSAGVFGKYINNPISQVLLNSALNDNTFVNAGKSAYVAGIEFEMKKNIWKVDDVTKQTLSFGINGTLMYSHQELDSKKVAQETNGTLSVNFNDSSDALQGASPLLLNADLTYRIESGMFRPTVSVVGNYFHDRIYSLGSFDRGNIVEKGIMMLNFVSNTTINEKWTLGLTVENILNSRIRRVQENQSGDITTYNYKAGSDFSLSIKYSIF